MPEQDEDAKEGGAGVVGLAIGFGAQTLVKDIISGIFFWLMMPSASGIMLKLPVPKVWWNTSLCGRCG